MVYYFSYWLIKVVLVTARGTAKVADFGFTTVGESGKEYVSLQGRMTPIYCAPELLVQERFSKKSDIWAFGCLLFEQVHACYDRRKAFKSINAITSYYWNNDVPPPQISWTSLGLTPHAIPFDLRDRRQKVEREWDFLNIVFAAIFRRNPDERPSALTLLQNVQLIAEGKRPTLPDYRPQNII